VLNDIFDWEFVIVLGIKLTAKCVLINDYPQLVLQLRGIIISEFN